MKIKLISDIHVEHHSDNANAYLENFNTENYDVLVLAGDIGTRGNIINFLENLSRKDGGKPKIYVPGNHEYYGTTLGEMNQFLNKNKPECVSLLVNDSVVFGGQRFVGSTLWFSDGGNRQKANVEDIFWSDFRHIQDLKGKAYELHDNCLDFLYSTVVSGDIVVTHHLPHQNAIAPRFKNSKVNRYFQTDIREETISKASHWLFGHTHDSNDFSIGNCRLISNPLGYPGENLVVSDFVFEVP